MLQSGGRIPLTVWMGPTNIIEGNLYLNSADCKCSSPLTAIPRLLFGATTGHHGLAKLTLKLTSTKGEGISISFC